VKHALRRLLASPVFALTAVVTLGAAIGAAALTFSVVHAVLLKPLPFPDPDRLVAVWHLAPGVMQGDLTQSPATYFTYRDGKVFEDIGLWTSSSASITGRGEPERVDALVVTDGTLPLLGVRPVLGRAFTPDDDAPGSARTVMLGHAYWQRVFGGSTEAIGQSLDIDGNASQVIGVLPPGFRFMDETPAVVLPFRFNRATIHVANFSYRGLARLKPGSSLERASADMARLIPPMIEQYPMPPGMTREMFREARLAPNLRPLTSDVVGDIGAMLWVLMGAMGIVLLVACANLANLFLVRAEGRQQELAIRASLGASRTQVMGQLLGEAAVLSAAAGALGLALAAVGIRLLRALNPTHLPRLHEIALDPLVVLFVLTTASMAALLFGLVPIAKYARPGLGAAMKEGGRGSSDGRSRHRARHALVVAQVALALVLLVCSGLMVRTFLAMRAVEPGFVAPDHVFTMRIAVPTAVVADPAAAAATHEQILRRIQAIPGVDAVGLISGLPMDGNDSSDPLWVQDQPAPEGRIPPIRRYRWISPQYFSTVGNTIIAGRDVSWADLQVRRPVVLLSEGLAREYWGSAQAAIGRFVKGSPPDPWREVIGVVGDSRDDGVTRPAPPTVYWPMVMADFWESPLFAQRVLSYAVRTPRVRTPGFVREVQQAVWAINPNLPVASPATLGVLYARSMAETEFAMINIGIAASVTLLLGIVGLYGVVAYIVAQRRREIGIRMALGADGRDVQRMFVARGAALCGLGLALGVGAALGITRLMSSLLFGVGAFDPATYAVVIAVLGAVALVATWLPARQAARIDPAIALRAD
jgi:putative ABC transport system permease protein